MPTLIQRKVRGIYSEMLNYNHNFTSFCHAGDQPAIVNIPLMVAERVTRQHGVEEVVDIVSRPIDDEEEKLSRFT